LADHSERALSWIGAQLAAEFPLAQALTVVGPDGELQAVWAYYNFRGHDIEISVAAASPRWCTRSNLRALFGYPFEQLGVVRITANVRASNSRSISACKRIGFAWEGTIRKGYNGAEDVHLFGMLREDCPWL
jgi:RimJ/RimL family protein N-acetyltransferase